MAATAGLSLRRRAFSFRRFSGSSDCNRPCGGGSQSAVFISAVNVFSLVRHVFFPSVLIGIDYEQRRKVISNVTWKRAVMSF
jgi:hypothetical protein